MTSKNEKDSKKIIKPVDKEVLDKAKNLLMKHPEITNNAKSLFRNQNGTTIVEAFVVRGDKGPSDIQTQYDVSSKDLEDIAKEASKNIDETLLKYDLIVACEDALTKVIWSKGEGKFASKINANTFALLLEAMEKPSPKTTAKEASEEDAPKEEEDITYEVAPGKTLSVSEEQERHLKKMEEGKVTGLGEGLSRPDADKILELKKEENNDAPKEDKKPDGDGNKEDKQEDPMVDKKAMKEELLALTTKVAELKKAIEEDTEEGTKEAPKTASDDIIAALEVVAGDLEAANDPELFKIAFQIDSICDVLEGREGATLQGDPDEEYMKKYFKGDVKKSDADEGYMKKDMQGDDTSVVRKLYKNASAQPPYQVK